MLPCLVYPPWHRCPEVIQPPPSYRTDSPDIVLLYVPTNDVEVIKSVLVDSFYIIVLLNINDTCIVFNYCRIEVVHKIMFGNRRQSVYVCIMHACARAVGKLANKRTLAIFMCIV